MRLVGTYDELSAEAKARATRCIADVHGSGADIDRIHSTLQATRSHPGYFASTFLVYNAPISAESEQPQIQSSLEQLERSNLATKEQRELLAGMRAGTTRLLRGDGFALADVHGGSGWRGTKGGPKEDFGDSVLALLLAMYLRRFAGGRGDGIAARVIADVAGLSAPQGGEGSDHVEAWRRRIRRAAKNPHVVERATAIARDNDMLPPPDPTSVVKGP
jgi:hypothetical protein